MNKVSKHYDLLIDNGDDPFFDDQEMASYMDRWDGTEFINSLGLTPEKSVLEIGCGTGRVAKKIVNSCKTYTGIDLSSKTIIVANKNFINKTNVKLLLGNFLSYRFNKKYDIIFSTLTFMHIRNKKKALKKVYKLLKPGGKFVLSISKSQQKRIDTGYSKITVFPDTPQQTYDILANAGFVNITVKEVDFAYIFSAYHP